MENRPDIIRSMVFVPAHNRDRIMEVAGFGPDAICMDLEDLTPVANKQDARDLFPEVAAELIGRGIRVMARVNTLESGMAEDDLRAIVRPELHCVNIPKTSSAREVLDFCALLDRVESDNGLPAGYTLVRPIIENALGVHYAFEIASASTRIAYMGGVAGGWWGDLASSLGYVDTADGRGSLAARSKVLLDVRAAGVPFPIGGGAVKSRGVDDIRAFFEECRVMGHTGAHCAGQQYIVETANAVFVPSAEEIEEWSAVLPGLEEAERAGLTSTRVNGKHLDLVCLPRIRSQLQLARRVGLLG